LIGPSRRSASLPWNLAASLQRRLVLHENITPAASKLPASTRVSGTIAREPKVA
jgi:hypothetical protein